MQKRRPARRVFRLAVLLLSLSPSASAEEGAPDLPPEPNLEDFLRVAELRSPGLEASRRLWQAEVEGVDAAGSFPDPKVSFAWFAREVETRVGPQKSRISLRQRLPWFGKLRLKEAAAEEGARATRAQYADRRLELRRDVTLAWLELYWLGRAVALTQENLDLLVNLERVIRERYRISRADHADLIRMQVELGVVENQLHSLQDRLRPATSRMNALLHRPEAAVVPLPEALPEWPIAPESINVFDFIRRDSPRLQEGRRRVAQADAGKRLADRGRWPDWTIGVDWIRTDNALNPALDDSGKDPFVVSLSVNVPVFRGKWDAPARAARERVAFAQANYDVEEDRLRVRAEEILFEWRDADRRVGLYRDALLPKARESYEAVDTAYRTGQGAFLDLMDAERTLLEFELEEERALADRGRSAAKLEYLMGERRETELFR
jgi:outer membrane protein TolC